jgi:CubicO group peptidase (beta-lactamase class C family)
LVEIEDRLKEQVDARRVKMNRMKFLNPSRVLAAATLATLSAVSLVAQAPRVQGTQDLSDAAVKRAVESSVADLGARGTFSGIVLAARGTQPIAISAAGYADRTRKTRITPSTRFTIGSMGKMFTATAIGQLVDLGRLSYDDVVGRFFPAYPNRTV